MKNKILLYTVKKFQNFYPDIIVVIAEVSCTFQCWWRYTASRSVNAGGNPRAYSLTLTHTNTCDVWIHTYGWWQGCIQMCCLCRSVGRGKLSHSTYICVWCILYIWLIRVSRMRVFRKGMSKCVWFRVRIYAMSETRVLLSFACYEGTLRNEF